MSSLPIRTEKSPNDKEHYNSIPVYYCTDCLSLKIIGVAGMDVGFCDDCNSTNIAKASIEEWQRLYKERYGFNFLDTY